MLGNIYHTGNIINTEYAGKVTMIEKLNRKTETERCVKYVKYNQAALFEKKKMQAKVEKEEKGLLKIRGSLFRR